jgi:C-terminal processing protease CtpA/Prc
VHRLSDGSALRLTVARWLTPQGTPIQGVGLAPALPVAAVAGTDAVLQSAVDYLRDQPRSAQADPGQNVSSAQASELAPAAAHQMPDFDDSAAPVVMLDGAERAAGGPIGLV